jgi:hypothetical protein
VRVFISHKRSNSLRKSLLSCLNPLNISGSFPLSLPVTGFAMTPTCTAGAGGSPGGGCGARGGSAGGTWCPCGNGSAGFGPARSGIGGYCGAGSSSASGGNGGGSTPCITAPVI